MKQFAVKIILCVSLIIILIGMCVACCKAPITNIPDDVPVVTELPATPEPSLPDKTVTDALLGRSKLLTVSDTELVFTVNLGVEEEIRLSIIDISYSVTKTAVFYEVEFADKTNKTVTINLTEKDFNKVISWMYN